MTLSLGRDTIESDVRVEGSHIGPNVTLERGARVIRSTLENCIVGPGALIEGSELRNSLVGANACIRSARGAMSISEYSEVTG